jgi:hypothetical protein
MRRNYWVYSIGLAVAWAIVFVVRALLGGGATAALPYVFGGFAIAWVAETIARWVYPPPRRWGDAAPSATGSRRGLALSYWVFSVGLAVVWAVLLGVLSLSGGLVPQTLWVFGGFAIGWVSGTIARYVYPPPVKWVPASRV